MDKKIENSAPHVKPTPVLHIIWYSFTIIIIRCRVTLDINTRNKEQHTKQGNTQMRHFCFIMFKWYIEELQAEHVHARAKSYGEAKPYD